MPARRGSSAKVRRRRSGAAAAPSPGLAPLHQVSEPGEASPSMVYVIKPEWGAPSGDGGLEAGRVVERAYHGERGGGGQQVPSNGADVVQRDDVDAGQQLVDARQLAVDELALGEAAHPGAGVLQPQDQPAAELSLATDQLGVGDAMLGHA